MEELIKAKKTFSGIGWRYAAGTAIIYALQLSLTMLMKMARPEWLENGDIVLLISVVPMYLVGMPLLVLMVKDLPVVTIERKKMKPGQFITAVVMCFGMAYIANLFGTILTLFIGALRGESVTNPLMNMISDLSPVTILIYTVILAPIVEEYIFRKLIVDRAVRYGEGVAILTSGLMFGLFHGNLNQFVYAFSIGVFLGYIYVKTGKLIITIAMHMMFNFVGGFASVMITRMEGLDEILTLAGESDFVGMMELISEKPWGIILYLVLEVFVIGMIIAAVVLFIVAIVKKRFALEKGAITIPMQLIGSIAYGNSGMIVFGAAWVIIMIIQLFQ